MSGSTIENVVHSSAAIETTAEILEYTTAKRTYVFRSEAEVDRILESLRNSDDYVPELDEPICSDVSSVDKCMFDESNVSLFNVDMWVRDFHFGQVPSQSTTCNSSTGPLCIIPSLKRKRISGAPQYSRECKADDESLSSCDSSNETAAEKHSPLAAHSNSSRILHQGQYKQRREFSSTKRASNTRVVGKATKKQKKTKQPVLPKTTLSQQQSSSSRPPTLEQYINTIDNMLFSSGLSTDDSFMSADDLQLWQEIAPHIATARAIPWAEMAAKRGRSVKYIRTRWFEVLSPALAHRRKRSKEAAERQAAAGAVGTVVSSAPAATSKKRSSLPQHRLIPSLPPPSPPPASSSQQSSQQQSQQQQRQRQQSPLQQMQPAGVSRRFSGSSVIPGSMTSCPPANAIARAIPGIEASLAANQESLQQIRRILSSPCFGNRSLPGSFSVDEDASIVHIILSQRVIATSAPFWCGALDAKFNKPNGMCGRRWQTIAPILRQLQSNSLQQQWWGPPSQLTDQNRAYFGPSVGMQLPEPQPLQPPLRLSSTNTATVENLQQQQELRPQPASAQESSIHPHMQQSPQQSIIEYPGHLSALTTGNRPPQVPRTLVEYFMTGITTDLTELQPLIEKFSAPAFQNSRAVAGTFTVLDDAIIAHTVRTRLVGNNLSNQWWDALDAKLGKPAGSCERRGWELSAVIDRHPRSMTRARPARQPAGVKMSAPIGSFSTLQPQPPGGNISTQPPPPQLPALFLPPLPAPPLPPPSMANCSFQSAPPPSDPNATSGTATDAIQVHHEKLLSLIQTFSGPEYGRRVLGDFTATEDAIIAHKLLGHQNTTPTAAFRWDLLDAQLQRPPNSSKRRWVVLREIMQRIRQLAVGESSHSSASSTVAQAPAAVTLSVSSKATVTSAMEPLLASANMGDVWNTQQRQPVAAQGSALMTNTAQQQPPPLPPMLASHPAQPLQPPSHSPHTASSSSSSSSSSSYSSWSAPPRDSVSGSSRTEMGQFQWPAHYQEPGNSAMALAGSAPVGNTATLQQQQFLHSSTALLRSPPPPASPLLSLSVSAPVSRPPQEVSNNINGAATDANQEVNYEQLRPLIQTFSGPEYGRRVLGDFTATEDAVIAHKLLWHQKNTPTAAFRWDLLDAQLQRPPNSSKRRWEAVKGIMQRARHDIPAGDSSPSSASAASDTAPNKSPTSQTGAASSSLLSAGSTVPDTCRERPATASPDVQICENVGSKTPIIIDLTDSPESSPLPAPAHAPAPFTTAPALSDLDDFAPPLPPPRVASASTSNTENAALQRSAVAHGPLPQLQSAWQPPPALARWRQSPLLPSGGTNAAAAGPPSSSYGKSSMPSSASAASEVAGPSVSRTVQSQPPPPLLPPQDRSPTSIIDASLAGSPELLKRLKRKFSGPEFGDRLAPGAFSRTEDAIIAHTLQTQKKSANLSAAWWAALDAKFGRAKGSCERCWQTWKLIAVQQNLTTSSNPPQPQARLNLSSSQAPSQLVTQLPSVNRESNSNKLLLMNNDLFVKTRRIDSVNAPPRPPSTFSARLANTQSLQAQHQRSVPLSSQQPPPASSRWRPSPLLFSGGSSAAAAGPSSSNSTTASSTATAVVAGRTVSHTVQSLAQPPPQPAPTSQDRSHLSTIDASLARNPELFIQLKSNFSGPEFGDRLAPGAFTRMEDAIIAHTRQTQQKNGKLSAAWWEALDAKLGRVKGTCERRWQIIKLIVARQNWTKSSNPPQPQLQPQRHQSSNPAPIRAPSSSNCDSKSNDRAVTLSDPYRDLEHQPAPAYHLSESPSTPTASALVSAPDLQNMTRIVEQVPLTTLSLEGSAAGAHAEGSAELPPPVINSDSDLVAPETAVRCGILTDHAAPSTSNATTSAAAATAATENRIVACPSTLLASDSDWALPATSPVASVAAGVSLTAPQHAGANSTAGKESATGVSTHNGVVPSPSIAPTSTSPLAAVPTAPLSPGQVGTSPALLVQQQQSPNSSGSATTTGVSSGANRSAFDRFSVYNKLVKRTEQR